MKKKMIILVAAATALMGLQQAQAADKEKYLIGGLIGGWILNQVFDGPVETRVYHAPAREVYVRGGYSYPGYQTSCRPTGRYEYRQVKEWIPGQYVRAANRCGRAETRWVPGHYEYRTQKVWVSYDRRYAQSYGYNRHSRR